MMIAKDPNAVVSFLFRNALRIQIADRATVVSILTTWILCVKSRDGDDSCNFVV